MRTLIVVPRFVARKGDYYEFPLGLCYVSACLKHAGFEVECLNLNHTDEAPEQTVTRAVRSQDIDVVMSGGLSAHYWAVRQIFDAAREARPEILSVAGGGLVSSEPELMLDATDRACYRSSQAAPVLLTAPSATIRWAKNTEGAVWRHSLRS